MKRCSVMLAGTALLLFVFVVNPADAQQDSGAADCQFKASVDFGFKSCLVPGYGECLTHVNYGGRAYRLGLEKHDVLLAVNGYRLTHPDAWQQAILAAARCGGQVEIKIRDYQTGRIAYRQCSLPRN